MRGGKCASKVRSAVLDGRKNLLAWRHIQGKNELLREVVECLAKISKNRRQSHSSWMTNISSSLSPEVSSLHSPNGSPLSPTLQLTRVSHTRTFTSFVSPFPLVPKMSPPQDFLSSPLSHLNALPSQAHLPGVTPIFVLLLSHMNLLPPCMSHFVEFKFTCFAIRALYKVFLLKHQSSLIICLLHYARLPHTCPLLLNPV